MAAVQMTIPKADSTEVTEEVTEAEDKPLSFWGATKMSLAMCSIVLAAGVSPVLTEALLLAMGVPAWIALMSGMAVLVMGIAGIFWVMDRLFTKFDRL